MSSRKKLLLVIKNRFWDGAKGSSVRIASLVGDLAEDHDVRIFYLRREAGDDRRLLAEKVPQAGGFCFSIPKIWPLTVVVGAVWQWLRSGNAGEGPACGRPEGFRDWLVSAALRRELRRGGYDVALFEYVWTAKFINAATEDVLPAECWLDTHDVMHARHASASGIGIKAKVSLTEGEETLLLERFSRIIAIQEEEAEVFRRMVPGKEVVTIPVTPKVETAPQPRPAEYDHGGLVVLHVSSADEIAVKSLRWFLEKSWPEVLAAFPGARLHVLGSIQKAFKGEKFPHVRFHGFVDRLAPFYQHAAVAINPCLAGSGLKIKTVEALAFGLPVVTTDFGAQGIDRTLPLMKVCAPEEIAAEVVTLLRSPG